MNNSLTKSDIERQNILNNKMALERLQKDLNVPGLLFENQYVFTKQMVADFYGIDISTVDRYLNKYANELKHNGYFLCKGKRLQTLKSEFGHLINEATKTTVLGLFNFRSFLNFAMLLSESDMAKQIRSVILDVVIHTINEKSGGGTKYINRRDVDYLENAIREVNFRKELTAAINECVSGHKTWKYAQVTDFIYQVVFKENAKQYKKILNLEKKDNPRSTMYAEVLLVIASFESGLAYEIRKEQAKIAPQLLPLDFVQKLVEELATHPMQKPYLNDARSKMASRDLCFRDAFHDNISEYLRAVSPEEFDRFIGDKSIDFDTLLEENQDVLQRLK